MATTTLAQQLRTARNVGTPLVTLVTPDQPATAHLLGRAAWNHGDEPQAPVIQWDVARGCAALNDLGRKAIDDWQKVANIKAADLFGFADLLLALHALPREVIVVAHHANRQLTEPVVIQALANLRDAFKSNGRMLILLGTDFRLPPELQTDVLQVREPLPTPDRLATIIRDTFGNAGLEPLGDGETLTHAVDALRGLSAFPAESSVALSLSTKGLDLDALWERKRSMIESTEGLGVWRGTERFDSLGGLDTLKGFFRRLIGGRDPARGFVFLDEIEKAFAGASGDNTGVSQELLRSFLCAMEDTHATGIILIGPGGTGKSAIAKAVGGEAGVPVIPFDVGGMKGSHVGESEGRVKRALQVVESVTDGNAFYIATCNSITSLPPELRRRFTFGTWFVDLPGEAERAAILAIYQRWYNLGPQAALPNFTGWTGAEIKQACHLAWKLDCSILEAAQYVVPIAIAAHDTIDRLRQEASGRFLSANLPGVYAYAPIQAHTVEAPGGRQFRLNS